MDRITDKVPSLRLGCRNYNIHVTVDISKEDEHKHNHHYDHHYDHHYNDLNWVIVLIRESETWPLETWSVERFADCSIDRRLFSRLLNCNPTNTSSALTTWFRDLTLHVHPNHKPNIPKVQCHKSSASVPIRRSIRQNLYR